MIRTFTEIPITDDRQGGENIRNSGFAPSQDVPEADKNPMWYFRNVQYFTTFYNRQTNYLSWPQAMDTTGRNAEKNSVERRILPVQFMIRMMLYYLGQQPNMDYSFIADDATRQTMQAMWIRGQSVKEFVDFFKGNMMTRLTNAKWTAEPMSKRATSKKAEMYDKLMLAFDMKPFLEQLKQQHGVEFSGSQVADFEFPEQVKEWMNTTWKEYGAELCTAIAEDTWFKNNWSSKMIQLFMHAIICSLCAMHHEIINGRDVQEVLMPYQVIYDNRKDNDYGDEDQFIGKIGVATPTELFNKFPGLTKDQRREIERIARDHSLQKDYNILTPNLMWWNGGNNMRNTITYVTMYWRTRHYTGKKSVVNDKGSKRVAIASAEDGQYILEDIACATLIGNKFIGNFGYIVWRYLSPVLPYFKMEAKYFSWGECV
jgi:hypothetical protein